jgi:hypothetical protein
VAFHFQKASLWMLTGVVVAYQVAGTLVEILMTWNLTASLSDIQNGYWGMLIQVLGGYLIINKIIKK